MQLIVRRLCYNYYSSDRLHAEIIKPVKMKFTQRIVKAELDIQKLCCTVVVAIAIVDRSLGLDFLESYKYLIPHRWFLKKNVCSRIRAQSRTI